MERVTIHKLTFAAVIAALYAALTLAFAPISFGQIQFRVSEVLCVLPFFFPISAWGLFVGCALANVIGGYGVLDICFGSLATLLAGLMTSKIRTKWLACLPPAVLNGAIVGAVLAYTIGEGPFWISYATMGIQVFVGELLVMYLLGLPLLYQLPKVGVFRRLMERNG